MTSHRTLLLRASAVLGIGVCALAPMQAQAWWRGGVFIGVPPVVIGPPAVAYPSPYYYPPSYYPPPYYAPPPPPASYAPPPASYAPSPDGAEGPPPEQTPAPQLSQASPPYGATCYAGVYTCAAPAQTPAGSGCSCPGLGAPSYGVAQ